MLSLRGAMVPTEIVLSPKTCEGISAEQNVPGAGTESNMRLMLEHRFSIPISIRDQDTDVIIVKELYPDRCPICGRGIPFLREMINRLESRCTKKIRCPLGHRYEGQIKIYYLNILQMEEPAQESKSIETCPECDSRNIQHLGPSEVFCLDCEWDKNMAPRF